MSNVLDWTAVALKKKANEAAQDGDFALAALLDNCLELYREGLIILTWESGEPYIALTDTGILNIGKVNAKMGLELEIEEYVIDDIDDIDDIFDADIEEQEDE
jgi:hypothetical protein